MSEISSDQVVDVQQIDSEPVDNAEPAAGSDSGQGGDDRWAQIEKAIGPAAEGEDLLAALTPKRIANMSSTERGVARLAMGAMKKRESERVAQLDARQQKMDEDRAAIQQERERLKAERVKLAQTFNSEEVKKYLSEADQIDEKNLDLTTPEGRRAFLKKEAAEGVRAMGRPVIEAATRVEKRSQYDAFVREHPKMLDEAFRKRVVALGKAEKQAGKTIQLVDAYHRVLRPTQQEQRAANLKHKRTLAKQSSQRVAKRSVSSTPQAEPMTKERIKTIKRKGYTTKSGATYTGELALGAYFKEHPEQRAAYLKMKRRA